MPESIKVVPQIKKQPSSSTSSEEKALISESDKAAVPSNAEAASQLPSDSSNSKTNGENDTATVHVGSSSSEATKGSGSSSEQGLLITLLNKFLTSENHGLIGQYSEILRRIIDNETMDTLWPNRDLFYSLLFKHFFPLVLSPLSSPGSFRPSFLLSFPPSFFPLLPPSPTSSFPNGISLSSYPSILLFPFFSQAMKGKVSPGLLSPPSLLEHSSYFPLTPPFPPGAFFLFPINPPPPINISLLLFSLYIYIYLYYLIS